MLVASAFPVLPASSSAPDAWVRDIAVDDWSGFAAQSSAASSWTVSEPLAARDTVMVGADWGGDPGMRVEVRGESDGSWSDWHALAPDHEEHEPDPGSDEAAHATTATAPVWLGEVERLQVRVAGDPPDDLTLKTVGLTGGDGASYVPLAMRGGSAASAAPAQPNIVSRSSWDPRGECKPRTTPSYARDVRFAYVHHTASTNSYSASEAPSMVLSFCLYHRNSRGWSDIGYNFLVDKYGRIYEGRAGGTTEPVIGAHAAGFNSGSVGVAAIGNFESAHPTADLARGIRELLAWRLDDVHVDPRDETTEVSGGGGTNRYASGDHVALETIVGHRRTGRTSCPGANLHDYIAQGRIHDDVDALGRPKLYGGLPPREEQPVIGERPHWQVKLAPESVWQLTIRDADGNVVRQGSDRSTERVGIRWDMRDTSGREVPPGRYEATFEAVDRDANPVRTTFLVTPSTERRHGPERIATSVALSRWAFDDARAAARGYPQAERVVVAGAGAFPDALVATPLAASYGAPVLLTRDRRLPGHVADEVRRLKAKEAYVVGGPTRVSDQVIRDLKHAGVDKVERLAGPTRYHTAARVAWRVVEREGSREAILAIGEHPDPSRAFPDALVAGAFGGHFDRPVMLVQPQRLPDPTQWVLEQRAWRNGVSFVGGKGVIRDRVYRDAGHAAGDATVREYAGSNRYDTARIVAEETLKRWSQQTPDPHDDSNGLEVVLATGDNWPDGLGAGAAAVARDAAFLLVPSDDFSSGPASREWINAHRAALVHAVVAGGPNAVSPAVVDQTDALIRSDGPNTRPPETWPHRTPGDSPLPPLPTPTP